MKRASKNLTHKKNDDHDNKRPTHLGNLSVSFGGDDDHDHSSNNKRRVDKHHLATNQESSLSLDATDKQNVTRNGTGDSDLSFRNDEESNRQSSYTQQHNTDGTHEAKFVNVNNEYVHRFLMLECCCGTTCSPSFVAFYFLYGEMYP